MLSISLLLIVRRFCVNRLCAYIRESAELARKRADDVGGCVERYADDGDTALFVWHTHTPDNIVAVLVQNRVHPLGSCSVADDNANQSHFVFNKNPPIK